MTFLLGRADGSLVDIDALWDSLGAVVEEPPADGMSDKASYAAVGLVLGVRLALSEPTVAHAVLTNFELRTKSIARSGAAEEIEITIAELVDDLLAGATVGGGRRT